MKNRIIKLCLLLTVMAFATVEVDAQVKKPNRPAKSGQLLLSLKVVMPAGITMLRTMQQPLHLPRWILLSRRLLLRK